MNKSHIWWNSGSWDITQNDLGQSEWGIFKSNISRTKWWKSLIFFACWYKFIEIKSWLKNTGVDVVINGCAHSGRRALKLAVSHEEVNGITWFLVCWYKFRKAYKVALIIWPPTDRALFSRKFIFAQIFGFFEKFCHVSFSWR